MLWEHSLVMIDKETGSLWSHLLGEAMRGPLEGEVLETIPSVMTDWKSWKEKYPQSTVVAMTRKSLEYTKLQFLTPTDEHGRALLIGLANRETSRAWILDELKNNPVLNDDFAESPLVIVYDSQNDTTVLHGRKIDDQVLTFRLEKDELIDDQTNSRWDLLTGEAVSGKLKGKTLQKLPGIISYDFAWKNFHPESTYWKPAK